MKRKQLAENVAVLAETANAQYRDIRMRAELAFRQGLLQFVRANKNDGLFCTNHLPRLLENMRDFWAFREAHFLHMSGLTRDISLLATATKGSPPKPYGIGGKVLGPPVKGNTKEGHATHHLHRPGDEYYSESPLLTRLLPLIDGYVAKGEMACDLHNPYVFFTILPFLDDVYGLVFIDRDASSVSPLDSLERGAVSELAQDTILETCEELVFNLADIEEFHKYRRDFLSVVDHELKDELILLYRGIATMKTFGGTDETFDAAVLGIESACKRLTYYSSPATMYDSLANLNVQSTDIHKDLLAQWQEVLRPDIEALDLRLITSSQPTDPIDVDREKVSKILFHLLRNATKFCHRGTKLYLTHKLSSTVAGKTCHEISVTDLGMSCPTGRGIYRMARRGQDRVPGRGIGLNVASEIAKRHKFTLNHTVEEVSDLYVPAIAPYVSGMYTPTDDALIASAERELARLKGIGLFDEIVTQCDTGEQLYQPTREKCLGSIKSPTFRVTFTLSIPCKQ